MTSYARGSRLWAATACLLAAPALWAQEFVGLVFPVADVQLSVPVAGVVSSVQVKLGDRIQRDQVVLQLTQRTQALELKRREVVAADDSSLKAAQQRRALIDELTDMTREVVERSQAISREEWMKMRLDQVSAVSNEAQQRAQKERERVERQQAQHELAQRSLRAPRQGVVVAIDVEPGEWAKPGEGVVRLVDVSQVEVRLNVSMAAASRLRVGSAWAARFEGAGAAPRGGEVSFVSPVADAASGLVEVRLRFDNAQGDLRPGTKATVSIGAAEAS